jgi:predicted acetyltransferase
MFHLTFPTISHKSRYLEMIEEWRNFESIPTSPRALFHGETFEEFLDIATKYKTANPNGINSTLFFFMEDAEIL